MGSRAGAGIKQSGYLMLASSVQEREVIDVSCSVDAPKHPSRAARGPGAQPEGPVGVAQ